MTNKGAFSSTITSPHSAAALRRLFQWIEARYGGIPMDETAQVVSSSQRRLGSEDLARLLRHEITALHVREFYPHAAAQALGRQLATEAETQLQNWRISTSRGLESSDVGTLGGTMPYNVAAAQGKTEAYFDSVPKELARRRLKVIVARNPSSGRWTCCVSNSTKCGMRGLVWPAKKHPPHPNKDDNHESSVAACPVSCRDRRGGSRDLSTLTKWDL